MRSFILAGIFFTSGVAFAQGGTTLPGGATIQFNRLFLHEANSTELVLPKKTPDSLWNYFNRAHCVCAQPGAATKSDYAETTFAYELLLQNQTTLVHRPLEIWVGASCDDAVMRPMNCHRVDSAGLSDIASIATTNGVKPEVPLYDLMNPEPTVAAGAACPERALSATEWAIADGDGDGTPDYFASQSIATDSLPPPQPTNFKASGAEAAIEISWDPPSGDTADIAYYQALCATDAGEPGRSDPPAARYVTPRSLCGAAVDFPLTPAAIDAATNSSDPSMAVSEANLIDGLKQLDATFICGESAQATATSLRLEHLKNGEAYTVVLLAIDKFGNGKTTYFTQKLTPQPVTDFWEDLQAKGSKVQGGFCLIAETYGDDNPLTNTLRRFRDHTLSQSAFGRWLTRVYYASLGKLGPVVDGHPLARVIAGVVLAPVVAVALLWHAATLPGLVALLLVVVWWRLPTKPRCPPRWLRRSVAVIAGMVAVMVAAPAHAQTAYWDNPTGMEDHSLADALSDIKWHVGIRVGPYTPQIDAEPGLMKNSAGQGPYRAMFGGYRITPMLDIDRVLWTGVGQLGIGFSAGYMGKRAKAYAATSDGSDPSATDPLNPDRQRSSGDVTTFRLIPLQLMAVYRFSYLDDEFGIPIVPYLRGGLGYYVWWSTAPSGSFSVSPTDADNKARGATAGLVGSVGLQIRAERIDAGAAHSMVESGILHAGFYGEYSIGWVNGFGDATKLNVGDKTWFAGVDFEF